MIGLVELLTIGAYAIIIFVVSYFIRELQSRISQKQQHSKTRTVPHKLSIKFRKLAAFEI